MSTPSLLTVSRSTSFSRLDFRAKLAVFLATTLVALMWQDPWLNLVLAAAVAVACIQVGVSPAYLGLVAKVMTPFFLILLGTHGFFNVQHVQRLLDGRPLTPIFTIPESWWIFGDLMFSREGALFGLNAIGKSLTLLLVVPLCVFTTDTNQLIVSLVRLRVPYKLAFVLTSTLRFFPLVFAEIQAVIRAQRLRGFAPEALNSLQRIGSYARIAVPVILNALHKAQQTEVVLQTRGFSANPTRTYLHDSRLRTGDWGVIALSALTVFAVAGLLTTGLGHFHG